MSRLLITGSRNHQWTPYDSHALLIAVREILEKTHALPILVHGGATGADTEAARMGQGSRGTWGCIDLAHQSGIPVYVVWNHRIWVYNPSHPDHGSTYTLSNNS